MDAARLPGTGQPEQVIAHVDMDCFYAACEQRREPSLDGEPLVIGMGYEADETIGAVATASYEAREYGVESAMAISEALDRLPRKVDAVDDPEMAVEDAGFYRPVDMEFYESVADEVRAILHDEADVVREVSIDEAYLDVTEQVDWRDAESWARSLKETIEDTVGVVASVGIAPTMSAAKVASDHDKPDGLVVIEPGEVRGFFDSLPVEDVHGVGPVTARELTELGIETAGDLAAADPETLERRFGERGREIRRFARGEDEREVTPKGDPKSLSRESAFAEATADTETKRQQIETLAEAVADRASRNGARYQTIGIKVVTPPYDVNTRAHSLPGPVDEPSLVSSVALDLLDEFDDQRVRKIGVRVSNLDFSAGEQASLDGYSGGQKDGSTPMDRSTSAAVPVESSDGQANLAAFADTANGSDGADGLGDADDTGDSDNTDDLDDADGLDGKNDTVGDPESRPNGQASLRDFE